MVELSRGQQRGKAVGLGTVPPVQLGGTDTAARASTARDRIVTIAEASVLAKGFAATSIEEVVTEAGITKSGFFYHFKDKNELAHEMIRRYVASNDELFDDLFGRARELTDDPLQAFLLGLKMLSEVMRDLPSLHPGCLIASVCYQERLFDRRVKELTESSVKSWNERFLGYLTDIEALYPAQRARFAGRRSQHAVLRRRWRHHHGKDAQGSKGSGATGAGLSQLHQAAFRTTGSLRSRPQRSLLLIHPYAGSWDAE